MSDPPRPPTIDSHSPPRASVDGAPLRPPLTDSPWFWVCLFASVAAAALVAIGPKYRQREARLESTLHMREHLARSRDADKTTQNETADDEMADDGDVAPDGAPDGGSLIKRTEPLIWFLVGCVAVGWCMLFWTRRRRAPADHSS
jgi:hypothetical protein